MCILFVRKKVKNENYKRVYYYRLCSRYLVKNIIAEIIVWKSYIFVLKLELLHISES